MRKTILLAVLTLFAAFGIVYAQHSGMGKGMEKGKAMKMEKGMDKDMGPMHGGMFEKLNLTDKQMEQLRDLRMQLQKDMIPKQADLKLAKLDMEEIMMKPDFNDKAALDQLDKISSIKAEIATIKLQHLLAARKILTADQVKEFMKMHREGMGFGDDERGPRGMMGGPMMRGGMDCGMGCCMGKGMGHGMKPGMGSDDKEESEDDE